MTHLFKANAKEIYLVTRSSNWQTICFMKDDERRKISKIKHWEIPHLKVKKKKDISDRPENKRCHIFHVLYGNLNIYFHL